MKQKVYELLMKLGANASCKGFRYIAEAVEIINNADDVDLPICSIYELVSQKHNDNWSRVERAIRHTILQFSKSGNKDLVNELFPSGNFKNANVLYTFYYRLKE